MALEVKRNGRRVTVPSRALDAAAEKLGPKHLARVAVEAEQAMKAYLSRVTMALIRRHSSPWSWSSRGGPNLMKRAGAGMKALSSPFTRRRAGTIEGVIAIPHTMAQQEFGGVIRAKNTRYLSIPLPAALNPDGTPRKRSARGWRNTFVVKGKRGTLVICTRRGKRTIPLYVLKPSVRIAPRLGLRKMMRAERTNLQRDIAKRIRSLILAQS